MLYFAHAGHHHETSVDRDKLIVLIAVVSIFLIITAIALLAPKKNK